MLLSRTDFSSAYLPLVACEPSFALVTPEE